MTLAIYGFALTAAIGFAGEMEIVAHRGESFDAPENTLAAFDLAWERGVKAIELDVHLTKDGRLVCCHDADTKRTAEVALAIKHSNRADLLALDVGKWKGEQFAGERLPSLEAALRTIPQGARCLIEVKVGPEAVPALVKAVQESGKKPEQLAVISFQAETIAAAKRQLPHLKIYYLASFKRDKDNGQWRPTLNEVIDEATRIGADGVDLSYQGPWDESFVRRIKNAKLEFYVWTVDDLEVARKFAKWGVNGITTNKAAWLRTELDKKE